VRGTLSRRTFAASFGAAVLLPPRFSRADPSDPSLIFRRLEKTGLGYQVSIDYSMPTDDSVELVGIGLLPPAGHFPFGTNLAKLVFKDANGNPIPGATIDLDELYSSLHQKLQYALYTNDRLSAGTYAFRIGMDDQAEALLSSYASGNSTALLDVANIKYAQGKTNEAASAYRTLAARGSDEARIGLSRVSLARGDFDIAQSVLIDPHPRDPIALQRIQSRTSLVDRIKAHKQAIGEALTRLDQFLEASLESDRPLDSDAVIQDQVVGTSQLGAQFDLYLAEFIGAQLYRNTSPYFDEQAKNVGHWRTQYRRFKQSLVPGSPQGRMAFRVTRFVGASTPANGFQFDYALQQLNAPGVPWTPVDYGSPLRQKAKEIADLVFASLAAVLA
jgi:hypothetical protein